MPSKQDILDSLSEAAMDRVDPVDEVKLSTASKLVLGGLLAKSVLGKSAKLPSKSQATKPISADDYARILQTAKNPKQSLIGVVGLLNICAFLLLKIPELRDLGFKIQKVVADDRLSEYLES